MTLFRWDKSIPGNNATADATINWSEGQSSATVNDSARAMMTAVAKYRDDAGGTIFTGGSGTAYTITTNQGFDTLAHLHGQIIGFIPSNNNGTPCTLQVDGLGFKPLRAIPGVELTANQLVAGTPYVAIYNNANSTFNLRGVPDLSGVTTAVLPIGGIIQYGGLTAPASNFALCNGALISTGTYATLFALMGYAYGGAGATFGVPDLRGRVAAGMDNMGALGAQSRLTSATMSPDGNTLGATGGVQQRSMAAGEVAAHSHTINISESPHSHTLPATIGVTPGGTNALGVTGSGISTGSSSTGITSTSSPNVQNTQTPMIQPTLIVNSIIRIL